jgi:hypothetical protein
MQPNFKMKINNKEENAIAEKIFDNLPVCIMNLNTKYPQDNPYIIFHFWNNDYAFCNIKNGSCSMYKKEELISLINKGLWQFRESRIIVE